MDLFDDLAFPQQGQTTSWAHAHSHVFAVKIWRKRVWLHVFWPASLQQRVTKPAWCVPVLSKRHRFFIGNLSKSLENRRKSHECVYIINGIVFNLIAHLFAALTCEISSWILEEKFHIQAHPRIIVYIIIYYMAVSHKDWELPNSRIWLAESDIDRGLDFPI